MRTVEGLSDLRHEFKVVVLALDRDCVCADFDLLGPCEGDVQAHHVVYQKHLVRDGLDGLLWEPLNGAAVCERHHRRHHSGRDPIPRRLLPQRCLDFVRDHDLGYYLERFYVA